MRCGRHCAGDRGLPLVGGEAKSPKELPSLNLHSLTELRVRVCSSVTEVHMSHLFSVLVALKEEEREKERNKERKGRKRERENPMQ